MKNLPIMYLFIILCLVLTATVVNAASLTQSDVDEYIKSMHQLKNSDDQQIKNLEASLKNNTNLKFDTDKNGKIAIVSQILEQLDAPQVAVLSRVVSKANFSNISDWAAVADKVTAAMMAVETSKEEPMDMSEMTPEMIASLPPAMQEQMKGAIRMMNAVKNVPQSDIKLINANYTKLQALMDK
jgi:hypothetical protein